MVSITNRRIIAAVLMMLMLALSAAHAPSSEAPTANDTARFLAGLPPSSSSPLMALTKDPAWLSHARYFDSFLRARRTPIFQRSANSQRNI